MTRSTRFSRQRHGFTLVEILVAMALTLFVMVILTQAFVTSLETFSGLKVIGELQAQLRTVSSLMKEDLSADHFEGKRRPSDPGILAFKPKQGFLYFRGSTSTGEGTDAFGVQSYTATDHAMHFTSHLRGNRKESVYSSALSATGPAFTNGSTSYFNQPPDGVYQTGGAFKGQWAEIAYFLVKTGTVDSEYNLSGTGAGLHALYRAQYVMPSRTTDVNSEGGNANTHPGIAGSGASFQFHSPTDVTQPANRTLQFGASVPSRAGDSNSPPKGAALVLSNVLSMQIQLLKSPNGDWVDPNIYDSSTADERIFAVKVTIRIWDSKGQQARQMTFVQDL